MAAPRPPSVSIVIPTLNAAGYLEECLRSIREQDYPSHLLELIVADGGSSDGTQEIARRYDADLHPNPLRTGEAGKAVGARFATGELLAFIDSDNILPERNWLTRMVEPFADPAIVAAEPLWYTYRATDGYISRYCALLGMNDPLCLFLGNYDRYSVLTRRWTGLDIASVDAGGYLKIILVPDRLPTMGANGFVVRRRAVAPLIGDFFFDVDVVAKLVDQGLTTFAKVKVGIVHIYCRDLHGFLRKQRRRVRDYLYYERQGLRSYPWRRNANWGLLKFALASGGFLPVLWQALVGFKRHPDVAWFFHPVACLLTLGIYGGGWLQARVRPQVADRREW